jgi:CTP synthase (UTP-ammonia lyase)
MTQPLRIGIIGDYNPQYRTHTATDAALRHAANALCVTLDSAWLPTTSLDRDFSQLKLAEFDALLCSPGSPYKSMHGALQAIRFAREKDWPFFGT